MPEVEQSLITDAHRAQIGVKSEAAIVRVREEDARRMRDSLGDSDPRYADGTGVAPPYVLAMFGGRPGGPGARGGRGMPSILPGGLLTQQEWRFTRPFRIDEDLTAITQVTDIRERLGGRYGYSVLVTSETDYFGADGEHVAAVMTTITQFDPKGAKAE